MKSGDLKKIISIQKQSTVSDNMGGETVTWVDHITGTATTAPIWAAIWPVSAKQQIEGMQEQGVITHRIRIRYRTGVDAGMRVKYGSKIFNIASPPINPGTENKLLEMLVKEAVA